MDLAAMKRREMQALCKRHGLPAGGSNADLAGRLAAALSGSGGAEEKAVGVVVGMGCLKRSSGGARGGSSGAAKKVTFVLEDEADSVGPRVVWSPVAAKTRGRRKAGETLPATEASGRRRHRKGFRAGGDSADEVVAGEVAVDAQVRRSRRNAVNSSAGDVGESFAEAEYLNNSANADGQVEEIGKVVDKKQRRKTRESSEVVVLSADISLARVSRRSTRSSCLLSAAALVCSPVVEKKKGERRKAGESKEQRCVEEQPVDAQDLGRTKRSGLVAVTKAPVFVESKRNRRNVQEEPAVQEVAKVEIFGRTTRSRSVAAAVMSPIVGENKRRRKTKDVLSDGELPTVSEVPINDAPGTKSLRKRSVQVKGIVLEEAQVGKKLENSRQTSRRATRGHQQLASSVENEGQEQLVAPQLRRSRRIHSAGNELLLNNNKTSETNSCSKAAMEANDFKITQPLTRNTAKESVEDDVAKEGGHLGFTEESDPVRRSRRKSVVLGCQEFENIKDEDVVKQLIVKEPVRRSTRKSIVPVMFEKEKGEDMVKQPAMKEPVRRSKRKSVAPVMLEKEKDEDVVMQPAVKELVRRSTRKSVAPVMLEKERKGIHVEKKLEIHVRRETHKSVALNAADKKNATHSELARRKESRVQTRVQFATPAEELNALENKQQVQVSVDSVQNDEDLQWPTRKYSNHNLSCNNVHSFEDRSLSHARVEGGLKLRKRRRDSSELSVSSNNSLYAEVFDGQKSRKQRKAQTPMKKEDNHERLATSQQQSKPTTSKGRPAKRRRTSSLQVVMSVEEPKADGMAEYCEDEVTDGCCDKPSSSIQEISQDSATGEEFPSAPLLGTIPEEICIAQSVNENIHESESGDFYKRGDNPEICYSGATECTHQCEKAQEHTDFKNESSHLSEVRFGGLDQSCIAGPVPHVGIPSENYALFDQGMVNSGVKVMQTLNDDSSEDGLGDLNKTAGISQEITSITAVSTFEAEAPLYETVSNNSMDSNVSIQDVGVALPEELGASNKLQIVNDVAPCTCDEEVLENDSCACDGANWTDIKSVEGTENGDIVFNKKNLEAFKSIAVAEEVPSCTVAGVFKGDTLAKDIEGIGMKNNDATLSSIDTSSSGNEFDGQSTKSLEVSLFALNPDYLPTVNAEIEKQCDEGCVAEVASQVFFNSDESPITVTEYEFAWEKDIQGVSTDAKRHQSPSDTTFSNDSSMFFGSLGTDVVPIDSTVGDHEEKCSANLLAEQKKVSREPNANESVEMTLADIIPAVLNTKDKQQEHNNAPGNLVVPPTEAGKVAEKNIEDADMGKCLRNDKRNSSLSTTLHVEGPTEDKSIFPILNDVERRLDGSQSSSGLKFLFAEEDKEIYLINNRNNAVKVDSGNKLIDCKSSSFYPGSDCGLEDEVVQPTGGDADEKLDVEQCVAQEEGIAEDQRMLLTLSDVNVCSSEGRHSLIGQKALFAEEGRGSYLTNDACVGAKFVRKTKFDDEIVSVSPESDCSLEEKGVVLAVDNPNNKLAMEQVQQVDVQEGTLEKTSLGSATPEYKHECGLPKETVLHSKQNKRCSSAEQSPFDFQSLFWEESIKVSMEDGALAFARVHAENEDDESKDCHVEYRVKKTPMSGYVSNHDNQLISKYEDCMYSFQQDKEKEGLPNSSHEEQFPSGQLGLLEAANCMKEETNSEEVAYEDEVNREPVHSTDMNSSCEKPDSNCPAEHASGISDAILSISPIAPANDNDEEHLSCSQFQLESTVLLDEPTGCSNTEELHQSLKEQDNMHKDHQIACGACKSAMIEVATAKDLESGVTPLRAEQRSNLQDKQLSSKLEGAEVVEYGIPCDKDVSDILEFGSAIHSVGKKTQSGSIISKDFSMDHYQQQEHSNDFSVERSEEPIMFWEDSVSRADSVQGTDVKPSFDLATLDCEHDGSLSDEAAFSLKKNDTGRCSSNIKKSSFGLEFLFSQENMKVSQSGTHDTLAFPSAENRVDESNVWHFECPVEKNVLSEPVSYQGSDEDLSGVKENGGCTFSSQQDNIHKGFSESSHEKDQVSYAQLNSPEEVIHVRREIIAEEVVCKEEENRESLPSAIDTTHEKLHVDEPAEHHCGVSGTEYCSSQSTPICDEVQWSSNSSQLESLDALGNLEAFSSTEMLHLDHKEECNEHNEDQVTRDIPGSGMSESAATLLLAAETSVLPDEQRDPMLEGKETVEQKLRNNNDTAGISDTGPVQNKNLSSLPKDSHMDSYHGEQLPNYPSAPKTLEESAICQDDSVRVAFLHVHDLQRDPSAPKSRKESAICQDDSVMDCIHEQELQERPSDLSAPKSPKESAIFQDESVHMNCIHEQKHPSDLSAPKSPEESAIHRDVSGSAGTCQTSRRRRIDEISTKMLGFKISTAVKGSYVGMDAPPARHATPAAALLRNRENTPAAKTEHPVKPNADRSAANKSSRRALQPIGGRPQ